MKTSEPLSEHVLDEALTERQVQDERLAHKRHHKHYRHAIHFTVIGR